MFSALFWFLIGSLLVIVIMIGGSEKRSCEGGFELQPPLVFEKRSNPQKREFSLLLNIPRSRYSVLGYNRTVTRTNINVSLNTEPGAERGREKRGKKSRPSHSLCTDPPSSREVKLRHVVYEVWSMSYLCFSFQIWYFWNWTRASDKANIWELHVSTPYEFLVLISLGENWCWSLLRRQELKPKRASFGAVLSKNRIQILKYQPWCYFIHDFAC